MTDLNKLSKEQRARKLLLAFKAVDYDNRGSINREKLRRFFAASDIPEKNISVSCIIKKPPRASETFPTSK